MQEKKKTVDAEERLDEIRGFYTHCIVAVIFNIGIFVMNLLMFPFWWFYWITLLWVSVLVFHWVQVFGMDLILGKAWEEKKLKELKK